MSDEVKIGQIWKYVSFSCGRESEYAGDYVIIVDIESIGSQPIIVNIIAETQAMPLRYDESTIKKFFKRIS
jgi:hypothetical protein